MKKKTLRRIRKFNKERDWEQFHTPVNLAKTIAIESTELLECFQWNDDFDITRVKEELADVICNCQNLLDALNLDVDQIINSKMDQNEKKYPVEKSRGKCDKVIT